MAPTTSGSAGAIAAGMCAHEPVDDLERDARELRSVSVVREVRGGGARQRGDQPRRRGTRSDAPPPVRGFERHGGVPEVLERHGRDVRGEQKAVRSARGVFFEGTERARRGDGEDVLDERGGARQTI